MRENPDPLRLPEGCEEIARETLKNATVLLPHTICLKHVPFSPGGAFDALRAHAEQHARNFDTLDKVFAVVARHASGVDVDMVGIEARHVFGDSPSLKPRVIARHLSRLSQRASSLVVHIGKTRYISLLQLAQGRYDITRGGLWSTVAEVAAVAEKARAQIRAALSQEETAKELLWYMFLGNAVLYPTEEELRAKNAPRPLADQGPQVMPGRQHAPPGWVNLSALASPEACDYLLRHPDWEGSPRVTRTEISVPASRTGKRVNRVGCVVVVEDALDDALQLCQSVEFAISQGFKPIGLHKGEGEYGRVMLYHRTKKAHDVDPHQAAINAVQERERLRVMALIAAEERGVGAYYEKCMPDGSVVAVPREDAHDADWPLPLCADNPLADPCEAENTPLPF